MLPSLLYTVISVSDAISVAAVYAPQTIYVRSAPRQPRCTATNVLVARLTAVLFANLLTTVHYARMGLLSTTTNASHAL